MENVEVTEAKFAFAEVSPLDISVWVFFIILSKKILPPLLEAPLSHLRLAVLTYC